MEQKKVDFFDRCRYWEGRLRLDGFPVGNIDGFRFTKKIKPLGCCHNKGHRHFVIEFSLAELEMPKEMQDSTIVHEILHTFPKCFNHRTYFHSGASALKKKYGVEVETCATNEEWQLYQQTSYYRSSVRYMYRLMVPPYNVSSALRMKSIVKAIRSRKRDWIDAFYRCDGKPCYYHLLRDNGEEVEDKRIYSANVPPEVIADYEKHFYGKAKPIAVAAQRPKPSEEVHDDISKPIVIIEQLSLF